MSSGFVSLPPSADAEPPEETTPDVVQGDGWWPDIDIVDLRKAARIDTTVTPERLREAVRFAMLTIDGDRPVACWREGLEESGAASLDAVPDQPTVGGIKRLVALYTRAIASHVAADLAERLRDAATTSAGHDRADELETAADVHRRNARWALADLVGRARATCELI